MPALSAEQKLSINHSEKTKSGFAAALNFNMSNIVLYFVIRNIPNTHTPIPASWRRVTLSL